MRVAITLGDPAGIGPEIIARALPRFKKIKEARFLVAGDEAVLKRYGFRPQDNVVFFDCGVPGLSRAAPGKSTRESARASLNFLERAVVWLKSGEADALVTGPISKEAVASCGFSWPGHTEYLADAFDAKRVEMVFSCDVLKVVVVTRHQALKDVPKTLTEGSIVACGRLILDLLRDRFKIKIPRIAVCGLNPHAGEGGLFGDEEQERIIPAIKLLNKRYGRYFFGPYAADAVFRQAAAGQYDLVMAMYHDQGLIPFKLLGFENGAHLTAGLPFVRTSPVGGTAFDIAGKNIASCHSMACAIELALGLFCPIPHVHQPSAA